VEGTRIDKIPKEEIPGEIEKRKTTNSIYRIQIKTTHGVAKKKGEG